MHVILLAEKSVEVDEIVAKIIAVYAIARTVQQLWTHECAPQPLLRHHLQEGMRNRQLHI